jgi:hypothetical protein
MIVSLTRKELKRALAAVEKAEAAGFIASEATFTVKQKNSVWFVGKFQDICEKAHPTDGAMDWGRDNFMVERGFTFRDGNLVDPPHKFVQCRQSPDDCDTAGEHCADCGKPRRDGNHS